MGLELIVSVQTPLLDKDPVLSVCSCLPERDPLSLRDAKSEAFAPLERNHDGNATLTPTDSIGCLVAKFPHPVKQLYVEMIHPADFARIDVESLNDSAGSSRWTHRLFPQRLEKGVILRSRLRGLFFPQTAAAAKLAAAYRQFAASPPPLTT